MQDNEAEQPVTGTAHWQPTRQSAYGQVSTLQRNQRWCSDGFEIVCNNGERARVIFALDTCDREVMAYSATTGGYSAYMVQSVMLACVENQFGNVKILQPVEWLSDNGSCYTARETITFAAALGIFSKFTPVRSPQSNSMAEALVKTFKRDYVFCNDRSDAEAVMAQLPG
ncbi:DDE-type integrase/transposase/recombinase [Desulfovibrio desulfuricans]|nr:DDE-type integrase/transposase/recombinase [Desulfovibrio desulfuricans]